MDLENEDEYVYSFGKQSAIAIMKKPDECYKNQFF